MMTRGRAGRLPIALAAIAVVVSGVACGSARSGDATHKDKAGSRSAVPRRTAIPSRPAGPLQTASSGGQPVLAMADSVVRAGQSSDAEAYVVNSADNPVRITAVTAVPVPGEPQGLLVHVGLQSTGDGLAAGRGWPPVPVRQAVGAEVPTGLTGIVFGIAGPVSGRDYAVAGLRVDYQYHGRIYATIAWSGEAACVIGSGESDGADASCSAFSKKINSILEKLAGTS